MSKSLSFSLLAVFYCFLLFGCIPPNQYQVSDSRVSSKSDSKGPESAPETVKSVPEKNQREKPQLSDKADKEDALVEKDIGPSENGNNIGRDRETNQELLDTALEFCQASSEYWDQGELDNALDALDKAYSLVLKVEEDDDPEVQQQKEDLRFTISKRVIEVYASRFTAVNGKHKAIPLVMNSHVERALNLFKGREKKFFINSYIRAGRYRPAIVASLKEAGLPEELSWLPLIESGYKVKALSRARALGPWQFIASTGYRFGLKRDTWIDERMDLEKSTKAAIGYLTELHRIFGDWTTALAAYNCGERRVLNKIKSQRISYLDNFWDLYQKLPRETAFYVPKFLAVLHIVNDPKAHGFDLPQPYPELKWEEVTINKQVHLKTLSKRLKVDYNTMQIMNAELRQYLTPSGPYQLKVPVGYGEVLMAKLGDIPVYRPPVPEYYIHKVRKGDSLSRIAQRYKTSIRAIMRANGLKKSSYLKVGWRLKIPTGKYKSYASASRPRTKRPASKGKLVEYTVKKGDSLWLIANNNKTTVKAIRSLNNLRNSSLQVGQVLRLSPGLSKAAKKYPTKKYRVRRGDSPYLIAKRYRMNLSNFLRLNKLTPRDTIFPGQTLLVKAK